ncbi:MAG TPA: Spy/CpxP family protein refolding chaperone [Nitrospiraceae bacterium]|nr:Spy/CpxP family protein refolding chaperone [Nitrospiraceae bacterium]
MKGETIRKAFFVSVVVVLGIAWTAASSTMSWADGPGHKGHGHKGHGHGRPDAAEFIWHILKAKEALGLSDDQNTKLRSIGLNFKKDEVKKRAEVELAEIDMHQLFHQQDMQAAGGDVEGAIRKLYGLKADARIASFKAFQDARGVLTPEQLKKLRDLHGKDRCSMDEKRSERLSESSGGDNEQEEVAMGDRRP